MPQRRRIWSFMHELSIVSSVVETVTESLAAYPGARVEEVRLRVGALAVGGCGFAGVLLGDCDGGHAAGGLAAGGEDVCRW